MILINSIHDINRLEESHALNSNFIAVIKDHFTRIFRAYELESIETFNEGNIVVLEKTDDVRDLKEIGLGKKFNGILEAPIEWVNLNNDLYVICLVINNDFALSLFIQQGMFDSEVESLLADYADIS